MDKILNNKIKILADNTYDLNKNNLDETETKFIKKENDGLLNEIIDHLKNKSFTYPDEISYITKKIIYNKFFGDLLINSTKDENYDSTKIIKKNIEMMIIEKIKKKINRRKILF